MGWKAGTDGSNFSDMNGYRADERPPWYKTERKRDWFAAFVSLIPSAIVWQATTREKAAETFGALLILYIVVTAHSELRRERWFWVTIAIFALAHLSIIAFFTFELPKGPAAAYVLPTMFLDGFVMYGLIKWLASRLS